MTCERCHQPIKPGESYDSHIPHSGNGAAPTVHFHKHACKRVPRQVVPEQIGLSR
ncbi:MAG: hypothetical protein HOY75_27490 [Streptomyces sp.]|nr:hypothetical protein [Streptomyces sp.]